MKEKEVFSVELQTLFFVRIRTSDSLFQMYFERESLIFYSFRHDSLNPLRFIFGLPDYTLTNQSIHLVFFVCFGFMLSIGCFFDPASPSIITIL